MEREKKIKERIYSIFADLANCLGYSDVYGRVIACLLIHNNPVSLSEVARETNYSPSMVSLSIDFLESIGMVKKVKKPGDRKLYLQATGNLLDAVKKIIIDKVEKKVNETLEEFSECRKELKKLKGEESKRLLKAINVLEKEIRRMEKYIRILSRVKLPQ